MGPLWTWVVEHYPGMVILLGAFLSGIAGLLVLIQQNKFERDMRINAEENLLRTKVNLEQTQEAIRQFTGGDSYCYLLPILPDSNRSVHPFIINVVGKYPLYDVTAEIADLGRIPPMDTPCAFLEQLYNATRRRSINFWNMNPKFGRMHEWSIDQGDCHRYAIHFLLETAISHKSSLCVW